MFETGKFELPKFDCIHDFLSSVATRLILFNITLLKSVHAEVALECETAWIQIRPVYSIGPDLVSK